MASISTARNGARKGARRILFKDASNERRTIHLGKMPLRDAGKIKDKVETILAATFSGNALDGETVRWLSKISDELHGRLADVDLVPPRATVGARLKAFVDVYIDGRADVKLRTRLNLQACATRLVEFFGADKLLRDVKPGDADEFCSWLRSPRDGKSKPYAQATASRTIKRAKQFFGAAVRKEYLAKNPFAQCKAGHQSNAARIYFVSLEEARKVLDACPDAQWRLLFALSRFGGLRCPSEHLALTWRDIDWARDRFRVRSCKTEHLADGGERWVPIFPELRPHLVEAFELAAPGTVHVVDRCRDDGVNLRTQLNRIIRRAGLTPWPRPWHNLRATRQTELASKFPLHVVCAWIGNKQAVAAQHYLTVTEDHFALAQRDANGDARGARHVAQQGAADVRRDSQESVEVQDGCEDRRELANTGDLVQSCTLPPRGLEPLS